MLVPLNQSDPCTVKPKGLFLRTSCQKHFVLVLPEVDEIVVKVGIGSGDSRKQTLRLTASSMTGHQRGVKGSMARRNTMETTLQDDYIWHHFDPSCIFVVEVRWRSSLVHPEASIRHRIHPVAIRLIYVLMHFKSLRQICFQFHGVCLGLPAAIFCSSLLHMSIYMFEQ